MKNRGKRVEKGDKIVKEEDNKKKKKMMMTMFCEDEEDDGRGRKESNLNEYNM